MSRTRELLNSLGWWNALGTRGPVRILALNAVIDSTGTGLALVCLPFFAVRVAGLSSGQLALALSAGAVCEFMAAVPNGAIAGRIGIRSFNVAARIVQALAYTLLAFSQGFAVLLVAVVVAAVGRAAGNGLGQALTAAVLGAGQRAASLGSIRALRNIGYMLSALLSALVLATRSAAGLRISLIANAISFLLGAYWISRFTLTQPPDESFAARKTDWSVLRDAEYFGLIVIAGIFTSSLSVLTIGLPLWALRHHGVPTWSVATTVMVNTILVVLLQFRASVRLKEIRNATRGIRYSSVAFFVMAVLIAITVSSPPLLSVPLLLLAGVALTAGELLESPSWWTLSFELAPPARKNEYMAAFDLSGAGMGIIGPLAMAGIVAVGALGWTLYGTVMVAAALCGAGLADRRTARMTGSPPDSNSLRAHRDS